MSLFTQEQSSRVDLVSAFYSSEAYNIMRYSSSEQIHTKWIDISEKKYSLRNITNNDLKVPEKLKLKCLGFTKARFYIQWSKVV